MPYQHYVPIKFYKRRSDTYIHLQTYYQTQQSCMTHEKLDNKSFAAKSRQKSVYDDLINGTTVFLRKNIDQPELAKEKNRTGI